MFQLMRKSVGGDWWGELCCRRLMRNCAGTERCKGLNSRDAGAGIGLLQMNLDAVKKIWENMQKREVERVIDSC